jgi:hypothetical protein
MKDANAAQGCQTWLDNSGPSASDFKLLGAVPAKLADAKSLASSMGSNVAADPLYARLPSDQSIVLCATEGPLKEMGITSRGTKLIYYVIPELQSSGWVGTY